MKIGDKISIYDLSYSFSISNGEFCKCTPSKYFKTKLIIVAVDLVAQQKRFAGDNSVNDLVATDGGGNFIFTQSRFCKLVDKEIKVRYFCNDKDVTDSISEETKRGLSSIAR